MKRFTLTHEHIALLRAANVSWDPGGEGAPGVDCKRPYGSGDVFRDMGRILDWEPDAEDEDGNPDYTDAQREHLGALHRQTEMALRIVLATGNFRPGVYEVSPYDRDWRLVKADSKWPQDRPAADGRKPETGLTIHGFACVEDASLGSGLTRAPVTFGSHKITKD